jgi:protein-L-isoaspartate(D-aspartate) O-methyltransferase
MSAPDAAEWLELAVLGAPFVASWWSAGGRGASRDSRHGDEYWQAARIAMVRTQLERRDVVDPRVLEAMRSVPRHRFVSEHEREHAYDDHPLPIGFGQTISQPYIVAIMSQLAHVKPGDRVLEIGTGSGYQAAVLAAMGAEVYGIEIVESLGTAAAALLTELGYANTHVRVGDGYDGWPDAAPFAAIVVAAAPSQVPPPLEAQLAIGGRLVAPVGRGFQDLMVVLRRAEGFERRSVLPVRFVPMVGRAAEPARDQD